MADKVVRVTGVGFAAPDQIRTNDAPVFEWIRTHTPSHADLFKGFDRRPAAARNPLPEEPDTRTRPLRRRVNAAHFTAIGKSADANSRSCPSHTH